jgi:hypothetical protein
MKSPIDSQSPEEMGEDAYDAGLDPDVNPFLIGSPARKKWFTGFYGRRVELLVDRVRKRIGLDHEPD